MHLENLSLQQKDGVLPRRFVPLAYDLLIKTDLVTKTFAGSVSILIKSTVPRASEIRLHLHPSTTLSSLSVIFPSRNATVHLPPFAYTRDKRWEQLVIPRSSLPFPFVKDEEIRLEMSWKGEMGMTQTGFYLSTYKEAGDEEERYYAQTQFQPNGARRAFPCFDEPGFKSTFQLRLLTSDGQVGLNNMPVLAETDTASILEDKTDQRLLQLLGVEEKGRMVKFERTPLMSSYLVAWAVGDFKYIEDSYVSKLSGRTVPLRIYATPDAIGEVDTALAATKLCVPLYEELFDMEYPLPKLDTLCVSNFGGGMENWGLIVNTERSMRLTANPSTEAKNRQLGLIAHEIAHQTFGDLVTCETWEQLWLNEGFASICGSLFAPEALVPNWRARDQFISENVWAALKADGRRTSHPIEVPIEDPTKVGEIFDDITYQKGSSVLCMIANMVGQDVFLKGVSIYLRAHTYGNATTLDLWSAIGEASGLDVPRIAKEWTEQAGYPVVKARLEKGRLYLSQERFLGTGDLRKEENKTIWHIPLQLKTFDKDFKNEKLVRLVMSEREMVVDLKGTDRFLLNAGSLGVFRTSYDASTLHALAKASTDFKSSISSTDALALLNDARHLSRAGYIPSSTVLDLIQTLAHPGQTYAVYVGISQILDDLINLFYPHRELSSALVKLGKKVFGDVVDRLGFEFDAAEAVEVSQLRVLAIQEAGLANYDPVVEWALKEWKGWVGEGRETQTETRAIVWALAVRHIGQEAQERTTRMLVSSADIAEKKDALFALTHSTSERLVKRTLGLIDDVANVKEFDLRVVGILMGLAANPRYKDLVWEWQVKHYDALWEISGGSLAGGRVPLIPLARVSTPKALNSIKSFFKTKDTSNFRRTLAQAYETAEASILFIERDKGKGGEVRRWLSKAGYLSSDNDGELKLRLAYSKDGERVNMQSSLLYLF